LRLPCGRVLVGYAPALQLVEACGSKHFTVAFSPVGIGAVLLLYFGDCPAVACGDRVHVWCGLLFVVVAKIAQLS